MNGEGDSFLKFGDSEQFERITGQHPTAIDTDGTVEFGSEDDERKRKLQEAINMENSSAYDDLDDFVYKQNKRRARTSGRHHHHRHISPSMLSPGRVRKRNSDKKPHKHRHHYRKHHHKKKRLKKWQRISLGILIALLSIIVIGITTVLLMYSFGKNELIDKSGFNVTAPEIAEKVEENGNVIVYKGKRYHYNENITTILCMGIDKEVDAFKIEEDSDEYATGGQADSLFLLSINLETGENKVINISRETMVEVNQYTSAGKAVGSRVEQICLAHAYGDGAETSCQNELVAVRRMFYNLPINSYLALNVNGIVPINDAIGGVTVVSPETIAEFTEGETYTLKGSLAQSFVESRSHETYTGNNLRMERQKIYLNSFALNLMAKTRSDLTTPVTIFNAASPYITTNLNANKVTFFAVTALRGDFTELNVQNVPGTVKQGEKFAEFYVNEKEFFELFLDTYYIPE